MPVRPDHREPHEPTLAAAGALALAVAAFGGLTLWMLAGEAVHAERLIAAIANCF